MFALALGPVLAFAAAQAADMTPEKIARANREAVSVVRALKVHVTHDRILPRSKDKVRASAYDWFLDGEQERFNFFSFESGKSAAYQSEAINGPAGFRVLEQYDRDNPPPLSKEYSGDGASGTIGPTRPADRAFRVNPRAKLLLEIYTDLESRSLAELVRKSTRAVVSKTPAVSELRCYELELETPEFNFTVWVDPDANFMIRKALKAWRKESPATKVKPVNWVKVDSFREFKDGVFLPTALHGELTELATLKDFYECRYDLVNESPAPENFRLPFPEWLRVYDEKTGKVLIWGKEDATPLYTFDNVQGYHDWYGPLAQPRPNASSLLTKSLIGITAGLLATVSLLYVRRRYFRKKT